MSGRKSTAIAVIVCGLASAATAQTHDQIVESCRQSVGRPFVQSCMAGRKDMLEECRKKATPTVRACVIKARRESVSCS